ncbi:MULTISPECIES: hypothetical protein [Pseudophaeobacter]|uniref:hypothetical protein n=1 Tax=Pseudophaeobacter TaxID=1541822 RepID=UPI001E3E2CDB|nr:MULTISPECIES: hypothetical protein [Pseudophaeobacter]MCD9148220.1 hypothetical protein [Pseudophaeobacter flagellatus]
MRRWMLNVIAITGLGASVSACGVDGEPMRPSLNAGVGVSNSGVHAGGSVGLHKGPLNVYLGF